MKATNQRGLFALGTIVALSLCATNANAQITGVLRSDVEGFFGSTSDLYQQSEAPIAPTWLAVGFPLPHGPTALPNIPNLYPTNDRKH